MMRLVLQVGVVLAGSVVFADAALADFVLPPVNAGAPVPLLGAGVPALVGLAAVARRLRKR